MESKLLVALKAFIWYKDKILLLKESSHYQQGTNTGKLDVVGGRMDPGEKIEESLLREIQEETGLSVKVGKPFFVNEARPVVNNEPWQIIRIFFECFCESDKITLSKDHESFIWISASEYKNYPEIIPNLYPAFEAYLTRKENPLEETFGKLEFKKSTKELLKEADKDGWDE